MSQDMIVLNQRQASLIQEVLSKKIRLEEPESDQAFKSSDVYRLTVGSELGDALQTIQRTWNAGTFVDFSDYVALDYKICQKSDMQVRVVIRPNMFARAQKMLNENLADSHYKKRFIAYQLNLRQAGGYEEALRIREADRLEQLRKDEEERKHRERDRLRKIGLIKNCYPESWNNSAHQISQEIGLTVTIEDIEATKISVVKEWLLEKNLGLPSDEQATVIANCHNSLRVIARAGSGKTRTTAQKILFLIYYLGLKACEVIALVFNREARKELSKRLEAYRERAHLPAVGPFRVLTFDSLAYNLVNPRQTILEDFAQKDLIKKIIVNAIDNEEGLRDQVETLLLRSFKSDWEKIVRLGSLASPSDLNQLRSFLTEETLDGKHVKSMGEKRIADFLFEHDIAYSYEMPFLVDDGHIIRPDFYIPAHKVIIEYLGLLGNEDYEEGVEYKRAYWNTRNDITLIEIEPGIICKHGISFDNAREEDYRLLSELISSRTQSLHTTLILKRLSDHEILLKLRDRIQLEFVGLLQSALVRAGQMNCTDSDLVYQLAKHNSVTQEERDFLNLLPKFLAMYRDRLYNNNLTDYSLIKKKAISLIDAGKTTLDWKQGTNGIDLKSVRFIFVDEFQDFSELFRGLLLAILRAASNALVNAVGDDWQMINRFAGSKPELFDQFETDYPFPKTLYLKTNYRSSGGIVDFCNAIMTTNGVIGQPAVASDTKREDDFRIATLYRDQIIITPRESYHFKDDSILAALFRIFKPVVERHSSRNSNGEGIVCLAISRTNNPPVSPTAAELNVRSFSKRDIINAIIARLTPGDIGDSLQAVTAHSSKGLEADAVVILQPRQFPMIHRRSIFLRFFGDTPENLLRDELNLFYVACSRAKSELFLLPEGSYMSSLFLGRLTESVIAADWQSYPCRLKWPTKLHRILIQPGQRDSGALFAARDLLISHGFTEFSRPSRVPTRSMMVRQDLLGTLVFANRIAESCSDFDLNYIIRDSLNHDVYSLSGQASIRDAIAELRSRG